MGFTTVRTEVVDATYSARPLSKLKGSYMFTIHTPILVSITSDSRLMEEGRTQPQLTDEKDTDTNFRSK